MRLKCESGENWLPTPTPPSDLRRIAQVWFFLLKKVKKKRINRHRRYKEWLAFLGSEGKSRAVHESFLRKIAL